MVLKLRFIKSDLDQGRPSPGEVSPSRGFAHQRLGLGEAWPTECLFQGKPGPRKAFHDQWFPLPNLPGEAYKPEEAHGPGEGHGPREVYGPVEA